MSHELALGIVAAARMLEAESKSKRRYASLKFKPESTAAGPYRSQGPWFVYLGNKAVRDFSNLGEALNCLADNSFFVSPTKAEEYLAKINDPRGRSVEFLVWTDM